MTHTLFKKILVPVDFTENSEIAIRKAIEMIDRDESMIVLTHVLKPLFSFNIFSSAGFIVAPTSEILSDFEVQAKLKEYEILIKEISSGTRVECFTKEKGSVQKNIIQLAKTILPDLVIISKGSDKHYFSFSNKVFPGRIAKKTGCPVLTIKPGSIKHSIRNIVLPVNGTIPERKLDVAVMIAKKFNAHVHLVTFPNHRKSNKDYAFIESFFAIKSNIRVTLRHGALKSHNLAKATLSYAEFIEADMILANPDVESCVASFAGKRHLSDMLLRTSPIQIMDIQPYS